MATRYTLIKGIFPIVGTEPDGDTIRFQPDSTAFVEALPRAGAKPAWSHGGTQISVRFEAIDALETHFSGAHQQVALGNLATQRMLAMVGFTDVQTSGTKVISATPAAVPGYIAANSLDSYGRVIAFVFAGAPTEADGSPLFLTTEILAGSVNVRLLAEGVVYPAFYTTLPTDLKDHLAAQSKVVREQGLGVWPLDAPSLDRAADVPDLPTAETLVMWPKLFRRFTSYFQAPNTGLGGFDAWLRQDPRNRDDMLQLPTGELGNMHDLVEITGNTVRLRYRPEDLVVLPDTIVKTPSPTPAPTPTPVPPGATRTVRIVAALVNPAGADANHETATLLNTTAASIDLSGWQIRDRQLQAVARSGQTLSGVIAAGETVRIHLKSPVQLGNSGDDIVLLDAAGKIVDQMTYMAEQAKTQGVTLVF